MKKYYSYSGKAKDPYLLHEVNIGKITTYVKKGFLIPKTVDSWDFPINSNTEILNAESYENDMGFIKLKNPDKTYTFYIYEGISQFIADINRQL